MPTISGKDTTVTVAKNGQVVAVLNAISYEVTPAAELRKQNYLGEQRPREERTELGWTGNVVYEVENAEADGLEDEASRLNDNLEDASTFSIQLAEKYPNGQTVRYSYSPCTIKVGTSAPGRTEKVTKTLEFSAADRKKVA